jgi:hypothetical protein
MATQKDRPDLRNDLASELSTLIVSINAKIATNGTNAISGSIMNSELVSLVNSIFSNVKPSADLVESCYNLLGDTLDVLNEGTDVDKRFFTDARADARVDFKRPTQANNTAAIGTLSPDGVGDTSASDQSAAINSNFNAIINRQDEIIANQNKIIAILLASNIAS